MREISRARVAARARDRRALRACDAEAEYAGVLATRGADLCAVAVFVDFLRVLVEPASAVNGAHTAIPSIRAQTRTIHKGRIKRTNPPLRTNKTATAGWEAAGAG
jgi:hypothetical protein